MARPSEKDRVKRHVERLTAANKVHDAWSERFRCDLLERYYEGTQWDGYVKPDKFPDYQPYTANYIFSNIQTNEPTLLFYRPQVKVEPRPPYGDDPQSTIALRAKLCEDTVQTFIDDPAIAFKKQTTLALRDANFRFGLVEVGYTADWIDNPHAGKPVLKEGAKEDDPQGYLTDSAGEPVLQGEKIAEAEQLFVKRLDPRCFRVSLSNRNILTENDWVGYFEWHYVEDVKRNAKYKNTRELKASGEVKDYPNPTSDEERDQHRGMVKLWKVWNLRDKTRCVLAEGHDKYLLEGEKWTFLPFAVLKFYERSNSFYPIPPVFNWISPQDTINEVRESRRIHRKRFHRRYIVRKDAMDATELEKIELGGDGTIAEHKGIPGEQPLMPVPDAPLGPDTDKDLIEAKDDFNQISGVGAEGRGAAEADTATQANIIDVRTRIRESASRVEVADWLGEICRLMLLTIREKMQLPFWIQMNAGAITNAAQPADGQDPIPAAAAEMLRIAMTYQEITAADLGNGQLDVKVDVNSLSPVSEEERGLQWTMFWDRVTANPQFALILSLSEPILRRTLKYHGITSEGDIREIANSLQMMLTMQMAAQAASAGMEGGGAPASGQPPGKPAGLPAASAGSVQ